MQRHFKLAAIATALAFSPFCFADTNEAGEAQVVVTSKRFPENAQNAAANITVITAEDIRNSPAANLPDLLKTVPGIDIQTLYGNDGMDATINLRGFGDMPQSNTLILIDGQRLNPINTDSIGWSAIPLNSIRRIEIMPGSGTVLYGDQATGGVINIITEQPVSSEATASVTAGSYGFGAADVNLSNGDGKAFFNIMAHYANAEGWRQNTGMNQQAVSGQGGTFFANGQAFANYAIFQDRSGLPGSLSYAAFSANPRSSKNLTDSQSRNGYRFQPRVVYSFSDTLMLETNASLLHESHHFDDISFSSTWDNNRDTLALTPRLRWTHGLGALNSESVLGMDYHSGSVSEQSSGSSYADASESSTALYAQNTTRLDSGWSVTAGIRSQRMKQDAHLDSASYCPGTCNGSTSPTRSAYELSALYQGAGWSAYAKTGTVFRFANIDELFGFDPNTYAPIFSGILRPQHGISNEIGMRFGNAAASGKASFYRLLLTDEIDYDSINYVNINLAPTERTGLETEIAWNLANGLAARLSYAYTDAAFRQGQYAGNEIPMVSRNKGAAQLQWHEGNANYSAIVNAVGRRRYSNDYANADGYFAGYATLDMQGNWDLKPYTVTLKLVNALNRHYASFGGDNFNGTSYYNYYYPADPRSLFARIGYRFK